MAKRSGEPIDDYSSEYYQSSLQHIDDYNFTQKVFVLRPALVTLTPSGKETVPYIDQVCRSDGTQQIVPDAWDHEHCYVCGWRIAPEESFWENAAGIVLCDECHSFVSTDAQQGKR